MNALVVTLILFVQPVMDYCSVACPCTVPAGVDWRSARVMAPRARDQAASIFLGVVVGADTLARDTVWMGGESTSGRRPIVSAKTIRYRFAVHRVWKGEARTETVIMSYDVNSSCGRDYEVDGMYLVYAERDRRVPAGLMTYSCSRVKPEGDIQDDLQMLGQGRPPRP